MANLTSEQLDYLKSKEFELWYYLPGQTPENSEDEEKGNCTFWIDDEDKIHFGVGMYTRDLHEVTEDYLDDVIEEQIEDKDPLEALCLTFMYNVLLRLGDNLYDLCEAAEEECKSFYYIVREKNTDDFVFEDNLEWDLSDFM